MSPAKKKKQRLASPAHARPEKGLELLFEIGCEEIPAGMVAMIECVAVSITLTLSRLWLTTYARRPSALIFMSCGNRKGGSSRAITRGTAAVTVKVCVVAVPPAVVTLIGPV